jgi:hypothetical protein
LVWPMVCLSADPLRLSRVRTLWLPVDPLFVSKDSDDFRETKLVACRHAGFVPLVAVQGLEMYGWCRRSRWQESVP